MKQDCSFWNKILTYVPLIQLLSKMRIGPLFRHKMVCQVCPFPSKNRRIHPPTQSFSLTHILSPPCSPVALLVKKGLCSYEEKAYAASKYIQPPGVVDFLIIDGDTRIRDDENNYNDESLHGEDYYNYVHWNEREMPAALKVSKATLPVPWLASIIGVDGLGEFQTGRKQRGSEITVAVLHVSYNVGYQLWDYLTHQTSEPVRQVGGPKLLLNGQAPRSTRAVIFLWIGFCVLMGACLCFCMVTNHLYEVEQQHNLAQQRRQQLLRRRLTTEQIEANFPVGVFDGARLIFEQANTSDQEHEDDGDDGGEDDGTLLVPPSSTSGPPMLGSQPGPHSLDQCTICLDEYVEGDKLRCLPCKHTFHATCISKWLTERSANCPVCRIDLYEEEIEEHPHHSQGILELMSSWMSIPPESTNTPTQQQQQQQPQDAVNTGPIPPFVEESRERWWRRGFHFGRWGREYLWPRRGRRNSREGEGIAHPLTEPLLSTDQRNQDHVADHPPNGAPSHLDLIIPTGRIPDSRIRRRSPSRMDAQTSEVASETV